MIEEEAKRIFIEFTLEATNNGPKWFCPLVSHRCRSDCHSYRPPEMTEELAVVDVIKGTKIFEKRYEVKDQRCVNPMMKPIEFDEKE